MVADSDGGVRQTLYVKLLSFPGPLTVDSDLPLRNSQSESFSPRFMSLRKLGPLRIASLKPP